MKIEAIGKPFVYRWPGGEVCLEPGNPIDLPPDRAAKLLARAGNRVRQIEPQNHTEIEPACRFDGSPLSSIYWEAGTGEILGPATPEYFARHGHSDWIVITFEGQPRWIHADRLRSRKAFETQRPPQIVEWVREPR